MNLTEFVLARVAEDERYIQREDADPHPADRARVLADCEAKRAIARLHRPDRPSDRHCPTCIDDMSHPSPYEWMREDYPCPTLRILAAVYSDHPDYQAEWRP